MVPVVTREGGMAFAFPDVCKVPAPPSPSGVPVPLPNMAQCSDADSGSCSQNTRVRNKAVLVATSEIPRGRSAWRSCGRMRREYRILRLA